MEYARVLVMVVMLLGGASYAFGMSDEEAWKLIEKGKTANEFPDAEAVILHDQIETQFKDNGASVMHEDVFILIQNERALPDYRSIFYDYNPRTAEIKIDAVKVYRADGKTVDVMPATDIQELPAPTEGMFWNFVRTIASVPFLMPEDCLYYHITRKGLNLAYLEESNGGRDYIPPQKDHFFDSVYFEDHIPIVKKIYTLTAPRTKPVQYQVVNGTVKPSILFIPGFYTYVWERTNVPAFEEEPKGSGYSEAACKLVMATLEDWNAKSKWAYEVNEPQFVISDSMRAKVKELTSTAKTDQERMFNLLHWVGDQVRYCGLDMGEGEGYTVHRTDEIFRDLVGVCKDKAAVLVSLLRAAGFETYFILTLAMEKAVDVPADQFNHGVVGVKNKDGSWTFLDPTWAPKDRPLFNRLEQEQPILIATPDGEDLSIVPYSPPEENPLIIKAQTTLSVDKPSTMQIQIEGDGYGDSLLRGTLGYLPAPQQQSFFSTLASQISPIARILNGVFSDPTNYHKNMTAQFQLELPDYTVQVEHNLYFIPPLSKHLFSGEWEGDYLYAADLDKRTHDLTLNSTCFFQFNEKITLPKGYRLTKLPEKKEMDNSAIALFYEVKEQKRDLVITQNVKLKKRWIAPEEYPAFRTVVTAIQEIRKAYLILESEKGGAK